MQIVLLGIILSAHYTAYDFAPGNHLGFPGKDEGFQYRLAHQKARAIPHPHLTISRSELAGVKARRDADASKAREDLIRAAEKALKAPFADPSESWYGTLRGKPFSTIYPAIYRHTALEPARTWGRALTVARAWAITGRPSYAQAVTSLLRRWASYGFVAEHYDVGMNYAVWALSVLECYDLLFEELTLKDHERLAAFFERCLGAILRNDCFWIDRGIGGGLNNHLAWHRYAAGAIAVFYGEERIVRFILTGPRSLTELTERGLRDEGLWLEGSIPYHLTAQYPIIAAYRLFRRHGIAVPEPANGRAFQDFFRGIYRVVLPDLTLPPIGDAYGMRRYLPDSARWEAAYQLWKDDLSAAMLTKRRRTDPWDAIVAPPPERRLQLPPLGSQLFPEHGYAVLRRPEGPPAAVTWNLLTTYDAAGVHSNADKLSFILYANGRLWLEDREGRATVEHAFSADIQRTLNRHTICHNTLLVDWTGQQSLSEKLTVLGFRRTDRYAQVSIADLTGRLYPGVRQVRSFVVTDHYALDVLSVTADREAEFVLPLHVSGRLVSPDLKAQTAHLPAGRPWSWLKRPRKTAVTSPLRLHFEAGGQSFHMVSVTEPAGELWIIDFPRDDRNTAFVPLLLHTVEDTAAHFLHLFTLQDAVPFPKLRWQHLKRDGLLSVTVTVAAGHEDRYLLPQLKPGLFMRLRNEGVRKVRGQGEG